MVSAYSQHQQAMLLRARTYGSLDAVWLTCLQLLAGRHICDDVSFRGLTCSKREIYKPRPVLNNQPVVSGSISKFKHSYCLQPTSHNSVFNACRLKSLRTWQHSNTSTPRLVLHHIKVSSRPSPSCPQIHLLPTSPLSGHLTPTESSSKARLVTMPSRSRSHGSMSSEF
jgi:hypothetical protein